MNWQPTIGLEIHAELKTQTKMFCDSLNDPDETKPNLNVCPICMAHPGTLPVINREALKKVIQVGLSLNGNISASTHFERKNYFYPDLPKGYQISQYQHPLVRGGYLDINLPNTPRDLPNASRTNGKDSRRIQIQRVHLEEDTGRLIHDPKTKTTLVDFNRAGIPLMELVTEPDMHSAEEARIFAEELKLILRYLDASDTDMEKGQMRIEANVSLAPAGSSTLGTKVELKNINSFRFAERAIAYEIDRQREMLQRGEKVFQETRGWDEKRQATVSQRSKEESHDYRYFPEPDLPPLKIESSLIEELRAGLPELPAEKLRRFWEEYRIDANIAATLVHDRKLAAFFEAAVSELKEWLSSPKGASPSRGDAGVAPPLELAANYLTTDVVKLLAGAGTTVADSRMTPENFAELITYLAEGKISSRAAKEVLSDMISTGADPSVIIEERELWQVSESGALDEVAATVIAANAKAADDYRGGKRESLQFLVGRVIKESRGANPETVRKLLEEKLK